VILYEDESSFYLNGIPHKKWSRKGQRPELQIHGGRERLNVIGALDPKNNRGFFQYIGNLNARNFLQFLKGILSQYSPAIHVYMILDNARSHHAKLLGPFL